jgi:hypothetical protein
MVEKQRVTEHFRERDSLISETKKSEYGDRLRVPPHKSPSHWSGVIRHKQEHVLEGLLNTKTANDLHLGKSIVRTVIF